jgi:hypothetical protein
MNGQAQLCIWAIDHGYIIDNSSGMSVDVVWLDVLCSNTETGRVGRVLFNWPGSASDTHCVLEMELLLAVSTVQLPRLR